MILPNDDFTVEQRQYLEGFASGHQLARSLRGLPSFKELGLGSPRTAAPAHSALGPDAIHYDTQAQVIARGDKLSKEEEAKREKNALDMWDEMKAHALDEKFPKGTDVFLWKFHGLFYVSPVQNAFMCRLRIPGGILQAWQMRGIADLADQHAGGYSHVTTRANLQLREIGPRNGVEVLMGLRELGLVNTGAGGDNIRNITCSPTAGIDPQEIIDTRPLARELHHYILNHRDLYGLPRKFNIAFDGGGRIASLQDTNDIGFMAVRVGENDRQVMPGVYLRLQLGGITGHMDFARDAGVMVAAEDCVPLAAAIVRVFIKHGDRTDRKKARLKYLLDRWGFEKFLGEVEAEWGRASIACPLDDCDLPGPIDRMGHIGVHTQKQEGLHYVGVAVPVGKLESEQMRGLASLAERCGGGTLRLTVWQNLIISDIPTGKLDKLKQGLLALGLDWRATSIRAGLVACTGNVGCKYAASDTKGHALELAAFLEDRVSLDQPLNIHLTGCPHSCAQHFIGDIGLLGSQVEKDGDLVEGYSVYVGGGYGPDACIAKPLIEEVAFEDLKPMMASLLGYYLAERSNKAESFAAFARRIPVEKLRESTLVSSSG